jgi:hypothetical protein
MRRIGVLSSFAANDRESSARLVAFAQGLQKLGWTDGRNVRIDIRSSGGDADSIRRDAAELVALAPDVILVNGAAGVDRCYKQPAPCRSCSYWSPIPSVPASSIAWHGRTHQANAGSSGDVRLAHGTRKGAPVAPQVPEDRAIDGGCVRLSDWTAIAERTHE